MDALSCDGVTFERVTRVNGRRSRHRQCVLDNVSIAFPRNKSIGILGHRGSGKSTLVKLITGALAPTSGAITRRCRVSFPVGYAGGMGRYMSGMENAKFLARLYGADIGEVQEFVAAFSGLGQALHEPLSTYSGEKRGRFLFSISYALPFDIYVGDGALAGGPPGFREQCLAYVQELRLKAGLIVVTGNTNVIRQHCDAVGVLYDRQIHYFETIREGLRFFLSLRAKAPAGEADKPDLDEPEPEEEDLF
jgi:capsular polysaccharide transport system ATP-binding protein